MLKNLPLSQPGISSQQVEIWPVKVGVGERRHVQQNGAVGYQILPPGGRQAELALHLNLHRFSRPLTETAFIS